MTTVLSLAALTVFCIVIEIWSRTAAYDNELLQSTKAAENVAHAAEEHVQGTLNTVTWLLDGVVERIASDGLGERAAGRLRAYLLTRVHKPGSPLQGLFIYDRHGNWLVTTADSRPGQRNNADRAYFIHHRDHADAKAHLGPPVASRATGEWVITLSRRIDNADGSFGGVALATIPVAYFQRYYERFAVGRHGAVLLATTDGTVITRRPTGENVVGSSIRQTPLFRFMRENGPRGTVTLLTQFDQAERLMAYRVAAEYPVIVSAALAKDEIFAHWTVATIQEGIAVGIMLLVAYLAGAWVMLQARHRERLEWKLRQAHATLEARNAALDRLASTDGLTGLCNRRHLDGAIATEVARALREQRHVALVMIDVDFFKRYNDLYGHAAGDDCLREVAAAIAAMARRPSDVAARFGGEEFAVLLPGTEPDGPAQVAEAIRAAVAARHLVHAGSPAGVVTVTAGVAALRPQTKEDGRRLIELADAALYGAKNAGRNQVGRAGPVER